MKFKAMLLGLSMMTALPALAQKPVYLDTNKPIEERVKDALNRMTLEEKVKMIHAQSKFSSAGVPRLGIPEVWATDGPHGIRPEVLWDEWDQAGWTNDSCIAYPALTCLSATWNPEMSRLYGQSIGEEARYRKKDILLGAYVSFDYTGKIKDEWKEDGEKCEASFSMGDWDDVAEDIGADSWKRIDAGMNIGVGLWYSRFNLDFTYQRGFIKTWEANTSNVLIRLGVAF